MKIDDKKIDSIIVTHEHPDAQEIFTSNNKFVTSITILYHTKSGEEKMHEIKMLTDYHTEYAVDKLEEKRIYKFKAK